jgi:hypothetical protein
MHPHEVFCIFLPALLACRDDDGFEEVASRSEERQDGGGVGLGTVCRYLDCLTPQVGDCAMERFVRDRSCENNQHTYPMRHEDRHHFCG